MINYLVWNIRGVENSSSLRRVRYLVKKHHLSLIALLEPKSTKSTVFELQRKLHMSDSISNDTGTIWIMWKDTLAFSILSNEAQQITLDCCYMGQQFILS